MDVRRLGIHCAFCIRWDRVIIPITCMMLPCGFILFWPTDQSVPVHDDVIKWKHFPRYWPFVRGNSPVPGEFPAQRPVTRSFDVFFDLRLNKRLSKQSWGLWFETLSCPLWRHRNGARSPLILIMTCRLFGAQPLSHPMPICHYRGPQSSMIANLSKLAFFNQMFLLLSCAGLSSSRERSLVSRGIYNA